MSQINLGIRKARKLLTCLGSGYVALDFVKGRYGDFSAVGGSCGNVMAILAWFGWNSIPTARIGNDEIGSAVLSEFAEIGVDNRYLISDVTVETPVVIQKFIEHLDGNRSHRFLLTCPDCGTWLPRFRAMTLLQANDVVKDIPIPNVFYFDRVAPSILKLARWAHDKGTLIVFEPSSIGDERTFQRAVELSHILKYSHDRLGYIPDLAAAKTPKIVIETLGSEGLRVRWRSRWSTLPSFKVLDFVDAAGSGDWCTAGLIHRLGQTGAKMLTGLRKAELDDALRFGQGLAAVNCAFEGARGTMMCLSLKQLNRALSNLTSNASDVFFALNPNVSTTLQLVDGVCGLCTRSASRLRDTYQTQSRHSGG